MIAALLSILLLTAEPCHANEPAFSPKVSFRVGNGILKNAGLAGGSVNSLGALNLLFNYFLSGDFALGLGYSTNPPFSGITLSSRYYFKGQGTRSRQMEQPFVYSERRDLWAHYIGLDLNESAYVMTKKNGGGISADTLPGSSSTLNATLGTDFRISRHFELTAEANMALMTISASNDYVQLKSYLLNTGISYVW